MVEQLVSIVAPVFICVGLGFLWERLGRGFDVDLVTTLITSLGAPCLVFHSIANINVAPSVLAVMAGSALLAIVVTAVIASCLLWGARLSQRAYLPALVFPNTGNMGLPLALLAFGETGLSMAIGVFAVYAVFQFTFGLSLASGTLSLRYLMRVPLLYATPLALVFPLTGTPLPAWVNNTTRMLGEMTIPLMLLALGVSLGRLAVSRVVLSAGLSVCRLAMGFAVGLLIGWGLDLGPAERGVLIIQSAMPAAVFNYLFAQRYGTAPEAVAGVVVISTALSLVTLPALLWFVL